MFITIDNNDIEVVILRKNNKNIYFRFKEDLKLYVTCSKWVSEKEIKKLIKDNEESILKMLKKLEKRNESNISFMYLGEPYTIVYDELIKDTYFDEDLIFTKDNITLNKFVNKQIKEIFTSRVNEIVKKFDNLPVFDLKFRKMKTRWGVCNKTKRIVTLNTELIKKRTQIIDYVIIHELCHFKHPHHQASFWESVAKYCPNHKALRRELKE